MFRCFYKSKIVGYFSYNIKLNNFYIFQTKEVIKLNKLNTSIKIDHKKLFTLKYEHRK